MTHLLDPVGLYHHSEGKYRESSGSLKSQLDEADADSSTIEKQLGPGEGHPRREEILMAAPSILPPTDDTNKPLRLNPFSPVHSLPPVSGCKGKYITNPSFSRTFFKG